MNLSWLHKINVVILVSYIDNIIFMHYHTAQLWRSFYTVVMMVLAFASLFAQAHSQFLSDHWYMRRLVLYSAFVFAGVVPVMHWVLHNGGFSDPLVQVGSNINSLFPHLIKKITSFSPVLHAQDHCDVHHYTHWRILLCQ